MVFDIKVFKSPKGKLPFYEFLADTRQKDPELLPFLVAAISKMRHRENWGGKISKKLRGDIFEIKADSSKHFGRIFYTTLKGQSLLLLSGYFKTTDKTDPKQIDHAEILAKAFKDGKGTYEIFEQDK